MPIPLKWFCVAVLTVIMLMAPKSLTAQDLTARCDPPAGSLERLTQSQKKAFMESQNMFIAGRYADALAELRGLLTQLPLNTPT